MPSVEGLKTWFDYELLIIAVVIALAIALWLLNRIAAFLGSLPLSSPKFALIVTGIGLGAILVLLGLASRYT